MWSDLANAAAALKRDGWQRDTAYWWKKLVSERFIWLELEWHNAQLISVLQSEE